ncbi:reverse transcriptase domain-containing protein [Tanacetum coccineum]
MIMDVVETFDNPQKINMKLNLMKCSFGVEEGKFLGYMVTLEGIRANPKKTKATADMQSPKTLKEMQSLSGKLTALNRFLSQSADRSLPFFETLKNITKENKEDYRWTEEAEHAFQELKKLILELPTLTTPERKEALFIYLAASREAVSGVLILNKPEVSGKLAKYAVELGAYNITYIPRTAVKGQVLSDFINEVLVGAKKLEICSLAGEGDLKGWTLYTDGASILKGVGAGLVLIDPSGTEYTYAIRLTFPSTNNKAEYEALLAGLRIAWKIKVQALDVKVDSKLVACQMNGEIVANAQEVSTIVEEEEDNWMTLIIRCLEEGVWPKDENKARALRMKISQYVMEDGVLFKKSYLSPMLSKIRGSMRQGYYWPTMHGDTKEVIDKCDSCQIHAPVLKLLKTRLTSIMSLWPFYQWGLDILGPLPKGPGKLKFIIVAIDYFTNWIEVKPLAKTISKEVKNFIWQNIVCRFGLPRVIVTDNGTQLVNDQFKS